MSPIPLSRSASALALLLAGSACSRSSKDVSRDDATRTAPSNAAKLLPKNPKPAPSAAPGERFCRTEAARMQGLENSGKADRANVYRRKDTPRTRNGTLKKLGGDAETLTFSLFVVNGFHIGELDGRAQREGDAFVHRDVNVATNEPCVLSFKEIENGFVVDERSLCPHGVGVDFGGTYVHEGPPKIASFDCKKAKLAMERLVCGDEVLGALDRAVDAAYRRRRDEGDAGVQAAQRAWVTETARCVEAGDASASGSPEAQTRCVLDRYLGRLRALEGGPQDNLFQEMKLVADASAQRKDEPETGWLTENVRPAGMLRGLLGRAPFYELRFYIDGTGPFDIDGYLVSSAAPQGLSTIQEGFLAAGPSADIWAALLSPSSDEVTGKKCIDLWSRAKRPDSPPPDVFERWRKRFSESTVHRHELR